MAYEKSQKRQILRGLLLSQADLISYNFKKNWQVIVLGLLVGMIFGWAI